MAYDKDKKRKAKFKLEDLSVAEVSLVSKPAIGRTYLLTKSADPIDELVAAEDNTVLIKNNIEEGLTNVKSKQAGTVPADIGVNAMNEKLLELLKSVESEEVREALTGAMETILTNKEAVPEDIMKSFYELAGYEIPTVEKEVEKEVIKEVEVEKIVEKIVEVEKSAEDPKEAVLKGLTPEALALFKEQQDKIEKAEAAEKEAVEKAAAEEQARISQEFIQKAADNWKTLPFTSEEFGPVLKAVEEKLDESETKAVMKVFEVAKGAFEATNQDQEFGNAGNSNGSKNASEPDWAIKAKAMVEKKEASSFSQAVSKLYDTVYGGITMAWEQPLFSFSAKAAKNLSTSQHQVVRLTTGDTLTVVSCAAVANVAIGVLQDKPTSGAEGNVMIAGISKVVLGGAVSRGQLIGLQLDSTSAPGRVIAATTARTGATKPIGRALQGGTASGEIIAALINFIPSGQATS
jgi:hypothetical protein